MDQLQHRVSAVYLREFGYKKGGQDLITTAELNKHEMMRRIGKQWVAQKSIDSVTTALNEFDITGLDASLLKLLEEEFGKVETRWPVILSELKGGVATDRSVAYITHFIASLLIRSRRFRDAIKRFIEGQNAHRFLRDVARWISPADVDVLVGVVESAPLEHRLNPACALVWGHI